MPKLGGGKRKMENIFKGALVGLLAGGVITLLLVNATYEEFPEGCHVCEYKDGYHVFLDGYDVYGDKSSPRNWHAKNGNGFSGWADEFNECVAEFQNREAPEGVHGVPFTPVTPPLNQSFSPPGLTH